MLIHKSFLATVNDERIPAQLSWTDTNPFAVRADFKDGSSWIEWTFSLSLLEDGLAAPQGFRGQGDVRVGVVGETVRLLLSSPEGQGTADLPWETVNAFVAEVDKVYAKANPDKAVQVSLDSFLRELGVSA